MKLSDFDYKLPKELIANSHIKPRDQSRLLVVNRKGGQIEHKYFYNILDYLRKGDVLVFNNSKVFKARIFGHKKTGGKIEFLVVRNIVGAALCGRPQVKKKFSVWEVMAKGKLKVGDKVFFDNKVEANIMEKYERTLRVKFNISAGKLFEYLEKKGEMPLPPYIKFESNPEVRSPGVPRGRASGLFYQTVYAKKIGSAAAPTAGFHFTPELIKKIKAKGIKCLDITLHVGPGTFVPVEVDDVKKHKMHEEFFEVKREVWNEIVRAKNVEANGCSPRVIAVGTTTARVLEHLGAINRASTKKDIFNSTDIFIYPPYDFKIVDALITNFHLPKSTLLMLVSAFLAPKSKGGIRLVKKIYQEAVKKKYRFYSFGDSMFIF